MVFKAGTFHGDEREEIMPQHPAVLEQAVAAALASLASIDATAITVTAKGDRIILTGSTMTPEEADRAAEAARTVKGVGSVEQRIGTA